MFFLLKEILRNTLLVRIIYVKLIFSGGEILPKELIYLLLFIGCILIVLKIVSRFQKRKLRQKIKQNWGEPPQARNQYGEEDLKRGAAKISQKTGSKMTVDDLTWKDLNMYEVFQEMNLTYSNIGAEFLYQRLRTISTQESFDLEPMIAYLAENPLVREEIQYHFANLGQIKSNQSYDYFNEKVEQAELTSLKFKVLPKIPFLSLILLFFSPALGIASLILSLLANTIIYLLYKFKLEVELSSMSYLVRSLAVAQSLSKLETPEREALEKNLLPVKKALKYGVFFRVKSGGELEVIMESLFAMLLLPFVSYQAVIKVFVKNQEALWQVWSLLGKYEAACAILNYRTLYAHCIPEEQQEAGIQGTEVYHPLVKNPVKNPLSSQKTTLITGSNASGKSTYIKSVAINCLLAQTINTALAETFAYKRGNVRTSMGVSDNLFAGDSYFMAEIKSLKSMLKEVENHEFTYCFIDEILRGTNTIERISASVNTIQWLSHKKCLLFVATHDVELPIILAETCDNIYFSETVDEEGFYFDYQLKKGINKERNAIKLLDFLGFPKEITDQSKADIYYFEGEHTWEVK